MAGHVPVLLDEVLDSLAPAPGEHLLDLTLGRAGHSVEILQRTSPDGRLVGVDRDPVALQESAQRLPEGRVLLIQGDFGHLPELREKIGHETWDLILADLGVSSPQIDEGERGFSFRHDGPLDMRMDPTTGETAAEYLARIDEGELARIIHEYGEDRHSRRIAAAIIRAQKISPLETTSGLAKVILDAVPRKADHHIHPATRTFQALRIEINREMTALQHLLDRCGNLLSPGGRLAILSYHSLEDRKVKQAFRDLIREGDHELVTPKPVRPGQEELLRNPRSRSVRMRVLRRLPADHRGGANR